MLLYSQTIDQHVIQNPVPLILFMLFFPWSVLLGTCSRERSKDGLSFTLDSSVSTCHCFPFQYKKTSICRSILANTV